MNSIRKWLYKPKKTDKSLLAQFYFADEELNTVASELDSFDSRKDPERCQALVAQLRACQDKVLTIIQRMMDEAIPYSRTCRDFRVKFPDDVVQENLAGQLWFGAECLAAGSSIMNRELESASMRPLARALTKNLDSLRHMLRDQCLVNVNDYTERIREALTIFDKLFAEFELSYVSAMVPVKSVKEYETIQEITVLFSETAIRAKTRGYITTDMIDEYDPALMFTIPRLAIICGLLVFSDGPLNPDNQSLNMSDMFRPFQTLLYKIRELLFTLSDAELLTLERALCSQEEPDFLSSSSPSVMASSSSKTAKTTAPTTTTIAVQTGSPLLKMKAGPRADDASSCCSSDRIDSHSSDGISLTPEEQRRAGRGSCVGQTDRMQEAVPSNTAFCEAEGGATRQPRQTESSSRQSRNLNKSDSNDSGLHSDVVSTSDSQLTISSIDSSQVISQPGLASPLQSPLMDEVVDFSMVQASTENQEFSSVTDTQCKLYSGDVKSRSDEGTILASHGADGTQDDGKEDATSAVLGDDRVSAEEEESFYTPSSGVSPLHQPCGNRNTELASSQAECGVSAATAHQRAASDCADTDSDDNKENIASCREDSEHVYSVLQKVQAVFSHGEPGEMVVDDGSSDNNAGDLNDSSLTDSTLTDLTPPTDAHLNSSSDDTFAGYPTSGDVGHSAVSSASPSNCDLKDSTNLPQTSCDNEPGNQKHLSESKCASDSGATSSLVVSPSKTTHAKASCAETETHAGHSRTQCDRCTQTPHSAINNSQSSKIHHHHNRQHSNPSVTGAPSVSSHSTPQSTASNRQSSSKADVEKRDSSVTAQVASSSGRTPMSDCVKKQDVDKNLKLARKGAHGSKVCRSSHRTPKSKSQHKVSGSEARLHQYEDNWSNCSSNSETDPKQWKDGRSAKLAAETSSGSSVCEESSSTSDCDTEDESCGSSETSSYNSESHDDEEIALAVQAAELANRNQARARFRSSSDMIHRLFVCISGVADQLQTNFAGDLRNILRVVFNLNCSEPVIMEDEKTFRRHRRRGARFFHQQFDDRDARPNRGLREPPTWIPDDQSTMCMSCKTPFTFVRRRHHCRNCGKIFCGRCSSNAVSLPHFGHSKPVRVCNHCFVFQVNPFAIESQI